jgi:UDP-N-acetylglucosamine:LPS N-acetylglucosamine transferase
MMVKLINKIRDHYFRDVINRINDLETGIRVLINSPSYVHSEETGFNGQVGRKQIFKDLLTEFRFSQIIETGTYLGDTTGYMARTAGIPVFSCEKNNLLHDLSKMRLKDISSVCLFNKD